MASDGPTVGWLRPGDRLVLACLCGATTTLGRDDLIRLLGADAPLDLIGLRVRCARCGQPPCDGRFDSAAHTGLATPRRLGHKLDFARVVRPPER